MSRAPRPQILLHLHHGQPHRHSPGTLYVGVSGNLHRRVFQHKFHHFEGFTDRYEVVRLLYWESYDDVHKALAREKQLKGWTRAKKITLIVRQNPDWIDLASEWYPWMAPDKAV